MKALVSIIYFLVAEFGGVGLFVIGVLDSSFFFFMPFGNDLLLVGLTARHPQALPYYAMMSTAGSVLGCSIVDWIARKGGEKGLSRLLSSRQHRFVQSGISKNRIWPVALGCIMPPPFPFTAMVATAAALQYPRRKLLAVLAGGRLLRFSLLGFAAIKLGDRILQVANAAVVRYFITLLCIVTVVGSVASVWARISAIRSRTSEETVG